ncbi:MAG: transketolase C-terminal domain-containing protein, partial [bacterium]
DADLVPPMVRSGDDYRFHITGLTHDERGYPIISAECQQLCVSRLSEKIRANADDIAIVREEQTDGADVVVVSYGISSRVATKAIADARKKGIKVGVLRLITVWPFPEKRIAELSAKVKCLVMPELNLGQMYREMERAARGRCKTLLVPHCGGWVHDPDDILKAIVEGAK